MEWFVNFYTAPGSQGEPSQGRPVEGVVEAGDIIFVPRGWWHMAINLEPTVAITQNYVSSANLPYVLRFLRSGRADLVSGCSANERAGLHNRFVEVLQKHAPDTLAAAEEVEAENRRRLAEQSRLSSLFTAGDCQGNAPSLSMKDTDKTRGFEFDSVHSDSTRGPSCAGGGFAFNFDLGNVDPH